MGQTRFDAVDPADRRTLFVDAIIAHRERASPFLTLEVDPTALEGEGESESDDGDESAGEDAPDPELGIPWLQFSEGFVNLDCTDEELEALKSLLEEYPAFTIDELTRPEDAEGINVQVSARADANRIADFLDAVFQQVYGLGEEFRVWVVAV
ncbi:hypothetical protein [Natronoglomus mannanivorans]|uniref:DUF7975 domain-containing protein n=1 Tax=Natronoglomus mannanivorans TaxID=2979990 RepID=A0AAP2YYP7_9EURY|nr:hypothetical protein [Halobacteria archaeon AArc-xg1-1]